MQINKYAIKHKILPFWSTMYKQSGDIVFNNVSPL